MMKKTFRLLCVTLLFSTLSAEVSILSENASYPDFAHLLPWSINVKSFGATIAACMTPPFRKSSSRPAYIA